MTGRTALELLGIAAAAGVVAAQPARAQCRLCETPSTVRVEAEQGGLVALQIETGLDFDRLILSGPGEGSAMVLPDGSRRVSGTITAIGSRAMAGFARVRGESGRLVRIELPSRIELHSVSGARITIDEIVTDLPPSPRLDSAGSLTFRFGGRLIVSGEASGDFRGDIPITVEYL